MNKTHLQKVKEFMQKAKQEVPNQPIVPSLEVRRLRARLIMEECLETIGALGFQLRVENDMYKVDMHNLEFHNIGEGNIVDVADGIADINVVSNGTAIAYGINIEPIQTLVDDSNLAKFRGDAHRNEAGKWIKPSDWQVPNIAEEIGTQILSAAEESNCCKSNEIETREGCCGGTRCVC